MSADIKGIPIEQVIAKYNELKNVWRVGEFFGISGQTIHTRLKAIGVIAPMNYFSDNEKSILAEKYVYYKQEGRLQELADELGRTKQFLCRKAKELGLTGGVKKYNFSREKHEALSLSAKRRIKEYGHPRGALGLKHSDAARMKMSSASKENWITHHDEWCSEERRRRRSDSMMKSYESGTIGVRSRCYLLGVEVGGKTFLAKSSWEYDIALYFEWLKQHGLISDWDYESKVFRFQYNTLGVRTYRPDFTIRRGERTYFVEVKGWEDEKYEIKKRLMSIEYPNVKVIYITAKEYRLIKKKHIDEIPDWGKMKKMAGKIDKICSVEGCNNIVHSKGLCRHHFYLKYKK